MIRLHPQGIIMVSKVCHLISVWTNCMFCRPLLIQAAKHSSGKLAVGFCRLCSSWLDRDQKPFQWILPSHASRPSAPHWASLPLSLEDHIFIRTHGYYPLRSWCSVHRLVIWLPSLVTKFSSSILSRASSISTYKTVVSFLHIQMCICFVVSGISFSEKHLKNYCVV